MEVLLKAAVPDDAAAILALRKSVAERLTRDFGKGHWSLPGHEQGVVRDLRKPGLFVVRNGRSIIATLRLATKKPWAIDPSYFSASAKPLYLTDMAVAPDLQRIGIGRRCVEQACGFARAWPADAIRLDAYNALAGAGGFYLTCGFREVGRVTYRGTPLIYYELVL